MKREDILDSLEFLDEELLREADQSRNADEPAVREGVNQKKRPLIHMTHPAAWRALAAVFAVFLISFAALAGILRVRNGSGSPAHVQSIESTEAAAPEENPAEQYQADEMEPEELPAAAAEENYAEQYQADEYAAEETAGEAKMERDTEEAAVPADGSLKMRVTSDAGEVVFVLNDTPAAKSLASQLPLRADTELYGSNEIVFRPEEPLDTENGMEGGGTAGYLGYFEPWNNIVMYYGDFDEYPGLYILGEAVSGAGNIQDIRGEITAELIRGSQ